MTQVSFAAIAPPIASLSVHVFDRYNQLCSESLFESIHVPLDLLVRRHTDLPISTIRRA